MMHIVVCVKVVPDTAATVRVENGRVTWGDAALVLNPWDEFAVEAALQVKDKFGGKVTVISLGTDAAEEGMRRALAMGCDQAVRMETPGMETWDVLATAQVLAAAVRKLNDVSMVFFGRQAIDGDTGMTPMFVAQQLQWPFAGHVVQVETITNGRIQLVRNVGEARQRIETAIPLVASIAKEFGEPRYPSFLGIRKAKRATIPVWTLNDLGIPQPQPKVQWPELVQPPQREAQCEFIQGDTPRDIAAKLIDKLLEEKVL